MRLDTAPGGIRLQLTLIPAGAEAVSRSILFLR
jgi:hypothetical protein